MIIYSNGCSHTQDVKEYTTHGYIDIVADVLLKEKFKVIYLEDGFFNKHKKKKLKLKDNENYLFKHAKFGKSNDLILFESLNIIHEFENLGITIDYAVIQLSGPNRRFHYDYTGDFININPHDNYEMGIKFEPIASEQTLQYITILQTFFEKYKIKFCFIPYMEIDKKVFNESIYKNFIDFDKFTTHPILGHRNYFRKKGMSRDLHGHPNPTGFYELAKKVVCFFDKNIVEIPPYKKYFTHEEHLKEIFSQQFIKKYSDKIGDATLDEISSVKKNKNII